MKQVIIIGTIHHHWTPCEELMAEIERHRPDKLFIELSDIDIKNGEAASIRDEMFCALRWAKEQEIPYELFDIDEDTLRPGVTGKEPEFMEQERKVKAILGSNDWRSLNNQSLWEDPEVKEIEDAIVEKYFDKEKTDARNRILADNITHGLVEGVNVVVTGAGHITHLLEDIPQSVAPLRTNTIIRSQ